MTSTTISATSKSLSDSISLSVYHFLFFFVYTKIWQLLDGHYIIKDNTETLIISIENNCK